MTDHQKPDEWERTLKGGLGTAPSPDFGIWQARHASDIAVLSARPAPGGRWYLLRMITTSVVALSVALLIVTWLWTDSGLDRAAFALPIAGVDNVQNVSWTTEVYKRVVSGDGKRFWYSRDRILHAYRHPGRERTIWLDAEGKPELIEISDAAIGRKLQLHPKTKSGVIRPLAVRTHAPKGPFAFIGEAIRDRKESGYPVRSVSLRKPRVVDGKDVNVVRLAIEAGDGFPDIIREVLFAAGSKDLIGAWASQGRPNFDPWNIEGLENPPEKDWSLSMIDGSFDHEIDLNPAFAEDDFSLAAPRGYTIEGATRPEVSEEELIEFLAVAARLNGGRFPDHPRWYGINDDVWTKKESDRTAAEQAAIDLKMKFALKDVYMAPVLVFEEQRAIPGTFRYVGAGHQLGDADAIVLWFRPTNQANYRVIRGNLKVHDMPESDLPLEVFK